MIGGDMNDGTLKPHGDSFIWSTSTSLSALRIMKPLKESSHFAEHARLSVDALEAEKMLIPSLKHERPLDISGEEWQASGMSKAGQGKIRASGGAESNLRQ